MRCPNCQLENPPGALRCDCGYDFPTGTLKQPYLTGKENYPVGTNIEKAIPRRGAVDKVQWKYVFILIGMLMGAGYQYHQDILKHENWSFGPMDFLFVIPWGIVGFAIGGVVDGLKKK
jgi:hypothetical protein